MPPYVQEVVLYGKNMVADPATPPFGFFEVSSIPLAPICRPTKLVMNCTSAHFDISAAALGFLPQYGTAGQDARDPSPALRGARSGLTLEGPFLEYTVARGSVEMQQRTRDRSARLDNYAELQGMHEPETRTYLFDASQPRPICLPWAGSLRLLTLYPGEWRYQYALYGWDRAQISPLESEVTLTTVLQSDSTSGVKTRIAGVPLGAHSYTYRDSDTGVTAALWPTVKAEIEDAGSRSVVTPAGLATTGIITRDAYATASQFLGRVGLGNARRLRVDGVTAAVPAVTGFGLLTFHLALY